MDDGKIVDLFWERSEAAIAETNKKYGKYCKYIANNILRSDTEAEECVADTYMNAWNSIPPKRPARLSTYLGRITRNLALNRFTHNHAQKRYAGVETILDEVEEFIPDPTSGEDAVTDGLALRDAINSFLGTLNRKTRIIFVKRYWYLNSISEIADSLGTTESSVKVTLHRTRERFKEYLQKREIL